MSNSNDKSQKDSNANDYGSDLDLSSMFDSPVVDVVADNVTTDAADSEDAAVVEDVADDDIVFDFGTGAAGDAPTDSATDSVDEHAVQFDNADSGLLDLDFGQPELNVDSGTDAVSDVGFQSPFDSPIESAFESPFADSSEPDTTNQEMPTLETADLNVSDEIENVTSDDTVPVAVDEEPDPKGKKKKAKKEKPKKEPKPKKEKKPGDGKGIDWTLWSYRSASIVAILGTVFGIVYCSVLHPASGATMMYHLVTGLSIIVVGLSVAAVPFLLSNPSVVEKKKDNAEQFKMRYGEVILGVSVVAMAIGLLTLFIELYKYDFIIKP